MGRREAVRGRKAVQSEATASKANKDLVVVCVKVRWWLGAWRNGGTGDKLNDWTF